jgi:plastocyanin
VIVDPGTTISWEWIEDSGAHYVVSRVRVNADPENVPDPIERSHTTSVTVETPEMKRYACYNHHNEKMRSAVVVAADEDRFEYARGECDSSIPDGDGIGHTGGDAANA